MASAGPSPISGQRFEVGHDIQLESLLHQPRSGIVSRKEHLWQSHQIGTPASFAWAQASRASSCVSGQNPRRWGSLAKP